ncbi:MAG: PucR family transcriptional regulator ligand-binding domain-containing protein [Nitriliruptoraceae bacterium]|nr:PucR family transcriptional regulator ligand-binding domain-containing protein [Nitriliruptoraceae bacterium]
MSVVDPTTPRAGDVTSAPGEAPGAVALPLAQVLEVPSLRGSHVLAGAQGLQRPVARLNVMEVPDILPWVKPAELLLTTAYPLRDDPATLPDLIAALDDAGLAGIAVKLGRYLDALPDAALRMADERGFPVVQLPDDVGFDEILHEVLTGILNRQAQALARSERIHSAFLQLVLRGEGLPELARDLSGLIDAPTAIVAADGRVLAGARLGDSGVRIGAVITLSAAAGRTGTTQPHAAVRVGDRELPAVTTPITAGGTDHGAVVALTGDPHHDIDVVALETAATVAALTLTKLAEVQAVEDKYRSDLVHDLLRHVEDPDDARRRAHGFGWDLDRRLIVLVVRLDEPTTLVRPDALTRRPPLAATVRRLVLDRDERAAVVRFSDEVVVLTAAFDGPDGRDEARAFVRGLVDAAGQVAGGSVSAGLSRPSDDVSDIPTAYDQASRALRIGRQVHGAGACTHFDDLGAYRLLSLVEDTGELRTFVHEVLGELATDDDTAADLRATLRALIDTGGNVAQAARDLHFHYNTLRYRIEKLERMLGPFMTDARRRLDVQLALLVLEMRGLDGRGGT